MNVPGAADRRATSGRTRALLHRISPPGAPEAYRRLSDGLSGEQRHRLDALAAMAAARTTYLVELLDRLQAGDVWVSGSRRYRSFDE